MHLGCAIGITHHRQGVRAEVGKPRHGGLEISGVDPEEPWTGIPHRGSSLRERAAGRLRRNHPDASRVRARSSEQHLITVIFDDLEVESVAQEVHGRADVLSGPDDLEETGHAAGVRLHGGLLINAGGCRSFAHGHSFRSVLEDSVRVLNESLGAHVGSG